MIELVYIGPDDLNIRHDDRLLHSGDRVSVSHLDAEAMIASGFFALAAPAPAKEE